MPAIQLTNNYTFAIERYEKRLRLIVFKDGAEYVCHKENRSKLGQFLNADEAKAFKGRLQLFKNGDAIMVEVKG